MPSGSKDGKRVSYQGHFKKRNLGVCCARKAKKEELCECLEASRLKKFKAALIKEPAMLIDIGRGGREFKKREYLRTPKKTICPGGMRLT